MATASLVAEGVSNYCPVTNHYRCSDGKYLLVTIIDPLAIPAGPLAFAATNVKLSHRAEAFLADENATVLDADGDPANGMTALASYPDATTHAEVLARLGYELVDGMGDNIGRGTDAAATGVDGHDA